MQIFKTNINVAFDSIFIFVKVICNLDYFSFNNLLTLKKEKKQRSDNARNTDNKHDVQTYTPTNCIKPEKIHYIKSFHILLV